MENKIKTILGNDVQLKPTSLGLTNTILKGYLTDQAVAVRIPKKETKELSSFNNEKNVLPLIRNLNLDVPELYYDPITRLRITQWIPDAIEYKDSLDDTKIEKVAQLLKTFHHANLKTGIEFNCIHLLQEYKSHITTPLYPLDQFNDLIDTVSKIDNPHILCHNDLVSGNLLFTTDRVYLIDYEYAKDNDPLFDIMSFFTENNITDNLLRNRFYHVYFGSSPSKSQLNDLSAYEAFHNLLWCAWANMMFDLFHDTVYKDIASVKYQALQKNIKDQHSVLTPVGASIY